MSEVWKEENGIWHFMAINKWSLWHKYYFVSGVHFIELVIVGTAGNKYVLGVKSAIPNTETLFCLYIKLFLCIK